MLTIHHVMTSPVFTVGPETPLKKVARIMIDHGISGLPVVDDAGAVLGIVSEADFLLKGQGAGAVRHRRLARLLGESSETRHQLDVLAARTAGEAMTSPPVTIDAHRPISEAAAIMTRQHVNRLPVTKDGRLAGIVTRADLVRAYLRSDEELLQTIRRDVLLGILWLDPDRFDVSVTNGEARIRGHVERRSTADIVTETLQLVPGIVALDARIGWGIDDRDVQPDERGSTLATRLR